MILSARLNELESKFNTFSKQALSTVDYSNINNNTNDVNGEVAEVVNSISEKVDFLEQVIYKIDNERITELEKKLEDSKNLIIQMQVSVMETNKQVLEFINTANSKVHVSVSDTDTDIVKENIETQTQCTNNNSDHEQVIMEISDINVNS